VKLTVPLFLVAAAGLIGGCATSSPGTNYREVDTMVRERVGFNPRVAVDTPPGPSAGAITQSLMNGTLDAERAVEIALLNNASLRGRIEELGIAHAELIQARIVSNPRAHASFRFPAGGGAEGTGSEAGIDMEFLDLLTRPLRTRVAAGQLEQAKLRLSHEILKLAVDVKAAFYGLQATLERLELRRTIIESMRLAVELAERQLAAGNIAEQDLASHRAAYHEAAVELRHDEAAADVEREKLALLMGVQDRPGWKIARKLPAVPRAEPDLKRLEEIALTRRWDLLAARREPAVLRDALKLARLNVWSGLAAGVDSERDYDGARGIGPDVEVPIPVFNQQQGEKAKVRAQLRQSQHSIAALEQQIRFEVRSAWTQLAAARKDARTYQADLVPLRKVLLEETLKRYNFMLEGVYQLLEAKRGELTAQRALIEAQKSYWTNWAELERAVGGRVPAELVPAAPPPEPVARASSAPAMDHSAHQHGGHE
jgi:outer membrane protein, heavy metal efflux system